MCIRDSWETFCSAQFTRWYLCGRKTPNALHACFSEISPTLHLKQFQCSSDSSNVRRLSSFQGRSSSASSFHGCLLQVFDGLTSLALCPLVMFQTPQHLRASEMQAPCDGCRPLIATIRQWTKIRHWVRYPLRRTQCYQSFLLGMDLEYSFACLTYYQELCIFRSDLPGLFDLITTTLLIIEICKTPTPLLKALNKHSITHRMFIEREMLSVIKMY